MSLAPGASESRGQEIFDPLRDSIRLLDRRRVARALDHLELGIGNGVCHLPSEGHRSERVVLCGYDERRNVDVGQKGSGVVYSCVLKHSEEYVRIHQGRVLPIALKILFLNALGVELPSGARDSECDCRGDSSPDGAGHGRKHPSSPHKGRKNLV